MTAPLTPSQRHWLKDLKGGLAIRTFDPLAAKVRVGMYRADGKHATCNRISGPMLDRLLYRNLVVWNNCGRSYALKLTKAGEKEIQHG